MLNYKNKKLQRRSLDAEQIGQYYQSNIKAQKDFKYGLEYERISIDSTSLKSAKYEYIEKIIKNFAHIKGWGILYDDKTVIGAMGEGSSISLEPGCQFELSLAPKSTIFEIEKNAKEILSLIDRIARFYNVEFLPAGLTPYSTYQNIDIVDKERYQIMANYLPEHGKFAPVMMRESAGVQLNVDYKSERDAMDKIKLCSYISPILTGFFANSPIRNNKLTNFKSFRALAWKFTGKNRCGLFYENLLDKKEACFDDYINAILDVPMLFVEREGKKIQLNGKITFRQFLDNGFFNYEPMLEDYILHSSLCFPDVRLKKCLEIRNHDSQNFEMTMCICALYKGLLNSDYNEIFKDFENMNAKEIDNLGFLAAKFGTDFKYKNIDCKKYVKKLFSIAKENLNNDEQKYLEAASNLLKQNKCPADTIIEANINNAQDLVSHIRAKRRK